MESEGSTLNTEMVLILGTSGMLLLVTAIVIFIYLYQRKLIVKKLEYQKIEDLLKKQELRSVYTLVEGQEAERKRIAQDLHDSLGSVLVTLSMYADTINAKADLAEAKDIGNKISQISKKAIEEMRRISHNLGSGTLAHFGLEAAIKDLIDAVSDAKTINITCHTDLPNVINKQTSINLYRIIQELINNTLKHAHATKINVEISQVNREYVSLIYEDNGIGWDESERRRGMGLTNIASRTDSIGGTMTIETKKGIGTTFIIEAPLHEKD